MDGLKRVEETWEELGYKIRPLSYWAFVRTEPLPQKTASGLIWLPPKMATFYGELPHMQPIKAVVCSVGPAAPADLVPGVRVVFQRLHFARHVMLKDGTYFGWINPEQIYGIPLDDEDSDRRQAATVERASVMGL